MKNKSVVVAVLLLTMLGGTCASAQEPIPATKNYVAWAHEFLRTIYPDLNGKGHALSVSVRSGPTRRI